MSELMRIALAVAICVVVGALARAADVSTVGRLMLMVCACLIALVLLDRWAARRG